MEVKIRKLTDTAKIPTRGSEYAAGYDRSRKAAD